MPRVERRLFGGDEPPKIGRILSGLAEGRSLGARRQAAAGLENVPSRIVKKRAEELASLIPGEQDAIVRAGVLNCLVEANASIDIIPTLAICVADPEGEVSSTAKGELKRLLLSKEHQGTVLNELKGLEQEVAFKIIDLVVDLYTDECSQGYRKGLKSFLEHEGSNHPSQEVKDHARQALESI